MGDMSEGRAILKWVLCDHGQPFFKESYPLCWTNINQSQTNTHGTNYHYQQFMTIFLLVTIRLGDILLASGLVERWHTCERRRPD